MLNQPAGFTTTGGGAGSTTVDANLTTVGSTRLAGRFTVDNPTTAVTVSSGVILAAGSSDNTLGAVAQGAGSTTIAPWYVISTAAAGAGSTTVDANLTSAGSTRVVGAVSLASAASTNSVAAFTVANPTTSVTVSSGVILGAGSSANTIGSVGQAAGSTGVTPWYVEGWGFSSAMTVRTTINSSVDVALMAASTARRACLIQNQSTGTALLVSFTTAAVTSGGAYTFQIAANAFAALGGQVGNMPNYQGPIRGKMNSTAVAGPVFVTEFNSS